MSSNRFRVITLWLLVEGIQLHFKQLWIENIKLTHLQFEIITSSIVNKACTVCEKLLLL